MNRSMTKRPLAAAFGLLLGTAIANQANATIWTTTYDEATYGVGGVGVISFDDWGLVGPSGVNAGDFQVGSGFNPAQLGQIQRVETVAPDWLTPDAPMDIGMPEFGPVTRTNASTDGTVNFYQWAYTTPSSTFNNMQIDKAGNYHIAKNDMKFGFYDTFTYHDATGLPTDPSTDIPTYNTFQPYAISDARGWCGSILASNPAALDSMYGQVTFDFSFDHKFPWETKFAPQLVSDFVMRSYGTLTVEVTSSLDTVGVMESNAVINNTNPLTGEVDPDYYNKVSFHGGGVVPLGTWVSGDSYERGPDGEILLDEYGQKIRKLNPDGTWDVTIVDAGTDGAEWHINSFGGYAFILRADGMRILESMDFSEYTDFSDVPLGALDSVTNLAAPVPLPPAVWLFAGSLAGLFGFRRKRHADAHSN